MGAVVLVGVLLVGLAVSAASAASVIEGGQTTGLCHRDIKNVFTNLRAASLTKHLPAFQRCAP